MRNVARAAVLSLLVACGDPAFEPPDGPGHWVLVDLIHTRLQNPVEHRLAPGVYSYQGVHGFSRLFDHLEQNGYPWRPIYDGPLTDVILADFEVLFINLLSEDYPDFEPDEIRAIQRFVGQGGGLVAISDHTNVYRHAERLNRIISPMGIRALYHTAVDSGAASVTGSGWIAIERLTDHPINDGIETISFQTGGGFEPDNGIAFLSDLGFADLWNPGVDGYYGNWTHDGDDEVEPRGRNVAVVAATTYGQGRVVVVGDQNIYGDVWLPYLDNFAHALNVFEWAAQAEDEPIALRDRPTELTELAIDVRLSGSRAGQTDPSGYYGLFHHLNRQPTVFARAVNRLQPNAEALILPPLHEPPNLAEVAEIRAWLQAGRRVVVLMDASRPHRPTLDLLTALAPDFSFTSKNTTVAVNDPDAWDTWLALEVPLTRVAVMTSPRAVRTSTACEVFRPGVQAATPVGAVVLDTPLQSALQEVTSRWGQPLFTATALEEVTSEWGEPLFAAEVADLARVAPTDAGELVVFLQDGFFTNRTLGTNESIPPPVEGQPAVEIIGALTRYLQTPVFCAR